MTNVESTEVEQNQLPFTLLRYDENKKPLEEDLRKFVTEHGITENGFQNLKTVISDNRLKPLKISTYGLLDVSNKLEEAIEDLSAWLYGSVEIRVGNDTPQVQGRNRQRVLQQGRLTGYNFNPVEQKVILLRTRNFTSTTGELDEYGLDAGPHDCVYVIFPETGKKPMTLGENKKPILDNVGKPATYLPYHRLMSQEYSDRPDLGKQVWFLGQPRGEVSHFGRHLPGQILKAALELGATLEQLDFRVQSFAETQIKRATQNISNMYGGSPVADAPQVITGRRSQLAGTHQEDEFQH